MARLLTWRLVGETDYLEMHFCKKMTWQWVGKPDYVVHCTFAKNASAPQHATAAALQLANEGWCKVGPTHTVARKQHIFTINDGPACLGCGGERKLNISAPKNQPAMPEGLMWQSWKSCQAYPAAWAACKTQLFSGGWLTLSYFAVKLGKVSKLARLGSVGNAWMQLP